MNQAESKRFVWAVIRNSLRRKAETLKTGDISPKAKQTDVTKVQIIMRAEAEKYDAKLIQRRRSAVEPEARQPVASEGPHDISQVRDAAAEGKPADAAGEHEPKAG